MADDIQRYTVHSPGDGYELENYLGDIATVIEHTNRRPVLLGYSHTAFFTVHYALKNPDKIAALILIEPALFNDREELLSRARKALEGDENGSMKELLDKVQPDLGEDPNLVQAYTRMVTKFTASSAAIGMELLARANHPVSAEQLSTLRMPVLLIGGTQSHAAYTVHRAAGLVHFPFVWWIQNATHLDIMGEQYADKIALAINTFCIVHGLDKPQLGS